MTTDNSSSNIVSTLKSSTYGAAAWYAAGLFIKHNHKTFFDSNTSITRQIFLFAVTIPVAYVSVKVQPKLLNISNDKYTIAKSTAIGLAAATILDGVAMTWFPHIYDSVGDDTVFRRGAGWILWGVGWFIYFGIV
ncbi:hypothetical protein HDU76_005129 [Blyttiomyces sp. JEL0837]|nr:hypothetical protein HDU76_005129 [Blyttiomyces sp. JEL0837]